MKPKKKVALILLLCLSFCLIYLILAAKPLDNDLQLIPEWTISITKPTEFKENALNTFLPFKLGQTLGYYTPEGEIAITYSFPYMASISKEYWTTYNSDATNTPFFNIKGEKVGLLTGTGFPFVTDSGFFLFLPGGMSFDKLDNNGQKIWRYEDTAPIVCFSTSQAGCTAGFADGKIIQLTNDGETVFSSYPGGSNYQIILGADISNTGTLTACVCGIDKQRFILFKNSEGQNKTIYHEYLTGNLREQTFVKFNKAEDHVLFHDNDGLVIVNCIDFTSKHIPIEGRILSFCELQESGIFFVLVKNDKKFFVYIFENESTLAGSFSFNAENAFISSDKNDLYIGRDRTITKVRVLSK